MKLKCVENINTGFLGFDFKDDFEIGKTYSIMTTPHRTYVYSPKKEKWLSVHPVDLIEMFIPEDELRLSKLTDDEYAKRYAIQKTPNGFMFINHDLNTLEEHTVGRISARLRLERK